MADNYVISPDQFFNKTIQRQNIDDYHRAYLFRAIFYNIIPGLPASTQITYFVASSATPQETSGVIPVDWMNSQMKIAGRTTYGEWNVTVRDSFDNGAFNYFKEWRRLVYEPNYGTDYAGQSHLPREYKQNVDLTLMGNRGELESKNVRMFKMIGAFPSTIGSATVDYSSESIVTFPITFAYDEFIVV